MEKPKGNIHRFLLSTPSRFVGEYINEDLMISHAWLDLFSPNRPEDQPDSSPTHRQYFVATVRIENPKERSIMVPNYYNFGNTLSITLSVFFGKLFEHVGVLQTQGEYCLPSNIEPHPIYTRKTFVFNNKPRPGLNIDLDISKFGLVEPILSSDSRACNLFFSAGGFYLRSLKNIGDQPEMAFVDLVTAGEILANFYEYPDEILFDEELKNLFAEIDALEGELGNISKQIKKRLYQVRRKYYLTISDLVGKNFFNYSECSHKMMMLTSEYFDRRVKASYDLRSKYIHTGLSFGIWIRYSEHMNAEIIGGKPIVDDKELKKLIMLTPTFWGLERIIRYCLLRFAHKHIHPIDDRLD